MENILFGYGNFHYPIILIYGQTLPRLMKIILFDLGETLESRGRLIDGAENAISSIKGMHDSNGESVAISLVSDFDNFDHGLRLEDVKPMQLSYYRHLKNLGITKYLEPLYEHVTLSAEIGVRKPDEKIFRSAINLIKMNLPFSNVLFVTEEPTHIDAARHIGMKAIHFNGSNQASGDNISTLTELIPKVEEFLE